MLDAPASALEPPPFYFFNTDGFVCKRTMHVDSPAVTSVAATIVAILFNLALAHQLAAAQEQSRDQSSLLLFQGSQTV